MTAHLTIAEKSFPAGPRFSAMFCTFSIGGWWETRAQAEAFAAFAEPVIEAYVKGRRKKGTVQLAVLRHADMFAAAGPIPSGAARAETFSCIRCAGGPWHRRVDIPEYCVPV